MEQSGDLVFKIAVAFGALTWIAILLRVYVRAVMLRSFGADDYLIIAAQVFMTILVVLEILGVANGFGKHIMSGELTMENITTSLKLFYFAELTYIVCTTLLKLSVGLFLLRIVIGKLHKWILWISMGVSVAFFFNWFFGVMFQCHPAQTFWEESPLSKKCLGPGAVKGITYTATALTTIVDLTYGILPMFIVKDLHAPMKHKLILCFILSLAMVASIATIIRIPFIKGLLGFQDFLYHSTGVLIWSTIEVGLGIVACSLATLRPLLHSFLLHVGLTTNNSNMGAYKQYGRSRNLSHSRHLDSATESHRLKIRAVSGQIGKPPVVEEYDEPVYAQKPHERQRSQWTPPSEWDTPPVTSFDISAAQHLARPPPVQFQSGNAWASPQGAHIDVEAQRQMSNVRSNSSSSESEIWGLSSQPRDMRGY